MSAFTEARMHLGVELRGAGRHPAALRRKRRRPGCARRAVVVDPAGARRRGARSGPGRPARRAARRVPRSACSTPWRWPSGSRRSCPASGWCPRWTSPRPSRPCSSKAIATLDVVSTGRAGWEPVTSTNWRRPVRSSRVCSTTARGGSPGDARSSSCARTNPPRSTSPPATPTWCASPPPTWTSPAPCASGCAPRPRPPDGGPTTSPCCSTSRCTSRATRRTPARRSGSSTAPASCRRRRCGWSARPVDLANLVERTVALRAADGITFLPLDPARRPVRDHGPGRAAPRGPGPASAPATRARRLRARFQPRRLPTDAGVAS